MRFSFLALFLTLFTAPANGAQVAMSGEFDLKSFRTSLLVAGVAAGVSSKMDVAGSAGISENAAGWVREGGQVNSYNLVNTVGNQAISAGIQTGVYGGKFSDHFEAGMTSSVVNLAMADAQGYVGDWAQNNGGEGTLGHVAMHAAVGCVAGNALGGDCESSAAGAAMSAVYAGQVAEHGSDLSKSTPNRHRHVPIWCHRRRGLRRRRRGRQRCGRDWRVGV